MYDIYILCDSQSQGLPHTADILCYLNDDKDATPHPHTHHFYSLFAVPSRPKTVSEVSHQTEVVAALKQALTTGNVCVGQAQLAWGSSSARPSCTPLRLALPSFHIYSSMVRLGLVKPLPRWLLPMSCTDLKCGALV